jgi:hypothetical protein
VTGSWRAWRAHLYFNDSHHPQKLTQVSGVHAQDILQLGKDLSINKQVFAEITSFTNFKSCEGEGGLIGLGFADISSHKFPTVLSNLKDQLRYPIFSLYLSSYDDYPVQKGISPEKMAGDAQGNIQYGNARPLSASSEIVFGGVAQQHYKDCITWHDLGQFSLSNGNTFAGYWDFKLDSVRVGGAELPSSSLAIVDSGSSFLIGPPEAIGALAQLDDVACYKLTDPTNPEPILCSDPKGFDIALLDCDKPIFDIEFTADGETYTLSKDDLVKEVITSAGPLCMLRILGTHEFEGWILGDVFLNRHYAAFDFGNRKVGFARLSTEDSGEFCQKDWKMDIKYDGKEVNATGGASNNANVNGSSGLDSSPPSVAETSWGSSTSHTNSSVKDLYGFIGVFVAAVIIALVVARRRMRYKRTARFEEQADALEEADEVELTSGVMG